MKIRTSGHIFLANKLRYANSKDEEPPGRRAGGVRGGEGLELTIKGDAKEIAALVLELQERRKQEIKLVVDGSKFSDAVKRGLDLPDLTAP